MREDESSHSFGTPPNTQVEIGPCQGISPFQMPWFPTSPAAFCSYLLYYFFYLREVRAEASGRVSEVVS